MKSRLLIIAVFLMISQMAVAQFEGHLEMKLYSEEKAGTKENLINMYVNKDRIAIYGEDDVKLSGMSSSGVIIRNDIRDFIVLTEGNSAFKITKSEIDNILGMLVMMANMGGNGTSEKETASEPNIKFTNKTKKFNGIEASEMVVENADGKNKSSRISIWLAPKININWGMLTESWANLPEDVEVAYNGVLKDNVFNGGNFPVYVEAYDPETQKMITLFEVTKLEKTKISADKLDVPKGVNVVGMNNFMQQMMMGN